MVGSINSGSSIANALNVETRLSRATLSPQTKPDSSAGDSANVGETPAPWRIALDSVEGGVSQLDLALAAGRDALATLNAISDAARNGGDVQTLLDRYAANLDNSKSALLFGQSIDVSAEPDAGSTTIAGADIRLGARGGLVNLPADASGWDSATLARAAEDGAAKLQDLLSGFDRSARALEAHAGFLRAAEAAAGGRGDIDADAARLLALQVSQGLKESGGAIVTAQPSSVLALFKA